MFAAPPALQFRSVGRDDVTRIGDHLLLGLSDDAMMTGRETVSGAAAGSAAMATGQWLRPLRWTTPVSQGVTPSGDAFGLPIGTVTFLLTDIEGSTLAWQAAPSLMGPAVARHYEILDAAVAAHGGVRPQEQGEGDSIVAAFSRASDALRAALDAQSALADEVWPDGLAPLKVRMAVHAGEAQLRNEANYVGQTIIRTARLRAIALTCRDGSNRAMTRDAGVHPATISHLLARRRVPLQA